MDKISTGNVTLKRKTKRQRLAAQLKRIKDELRKCMHQNPIQTGFWLRRVVQGHINYYGVPFNSKAIGQFVYQVTKLWLKMLRRRSQRKNVSSARTDLCGGWLETAIPTVTGQNDSYQI